jgi:hypothetical protein
MGRESYGSPLPFDHRESFRLPKSEGGRPVAILDVLGLTLAMQDCFQNVGWQMPSHIPNFNSRRHNVAQLAEKHIGLPCSTDDPQHIRRRCAERIPKFLLGKYPVAASGTCTIDDTKIGQDASLLTRSIGPRGPNDFPKTSDELNMPRFTARSHLGRSAAFFPKRW